MASGGEMHDMYDELNPRGQLPFNLRTHEEYFNGCEKCEQKVTIETEHQRMSLLKKLRFEKGNGIRGRQ
eukprot:2776071-Pyramimonas_sp.AAC.1